MFIFTKPHRLFKRKPDKKAQVVLDQLDNFLKDSTPQLVGLLYRTFQDQQAAISYEELREAALDGYEKEIQQWQEDYAVFVNEKLKPMWLQAMKTAADKLNEKYEGFAFLDSEKEVQEWLSSHGAEFVTNIGESTRQAIKNILYMGQNEGWSNGKMAKMIRPCIGLTKGDAAANARYQQSVFDSYMKAHPKANPEKAAQKAHEAALKYAARQHRARAENIANTEMAFAYNRGYHEGVRQAMRQGFMGTVVKVWSTAGSERVCKHCSSLNGKVVGFEENFDIKGRELYRGMHQTPPAHPSCRCAIQYREIAPPATMVAGGQEEQ